MARRSIAVFDLGGVLIRWDPRNLYRKLISGDAEVERFLATVCTEEWNERQDAGRTFAEAEAEAIARHPDKADLIRAWHARFDEMIPGALDEVVGILEELRRRGVPLYAVSNWSAETFLSQPARFPFLGWFRDIVVSGREGVIKPDSRIFEILLRRNAIDAREAVFIDDVPANAAAATGLGFHGIPFRDAGALRAELMRVGLL